MFSLKTRKPSTRELVRAEHRLLATRPSRPWLWLMFAMFCLIVALLYLRDHEGAAHRQQLAALRAENQVMQAALEQERLRHQEAQATEQQLLKRIALLSAQAERLQTDLAFYRQQKKAR